MRLFLERKSGGNRFEGLQKALLDDLDQFGVKAQVPAELNLDSGMSAAALFHEAGQVLPNMIAQVQEVGQENDSIRAGLGVKIDPLGDRWDVDLEEGRAEPIGGPFDLETVDDLVHGPVGRLRAASVAEEEAGRMPRTLRAVAQDMHSPSPRSST